MKHNMLICCLVVTGLMLTGCTTTKVKRVEVDESIDLSGYWNDYDAKLVAEAMVEDALDGRWLREFNKAKGQSPFVIVGHVRNLSDEHIDASVFVKYLERALTNSGEVVFVASPDERDLIREERADQQQGFTDPETMAAVGRERGADYMMIGNMSSVKDEVRGKKVIYYQVNLELIDLSTNTKAWIGQKEIKKYVTQSKFSL